MNKSSRQSRTSILERAYNRCDRSRIQALISEAIADSNDESDEHTGILGMVREEVVCPFPARLNGEDVECLRLEWPKKGYGLEAVCRTAKGRTKSADIGELALVEPLPEGYPWIEAYLTWRAQMV